MRAQLITDARTRFVLSLSCFDLDTESVSLTPVRSDARRCQHCNMRTHTALTLLLFAGRARLESTINIDINISEDNDISEGVSARDTTSTVYKAAEGNFETAEDACDNTTVSVGEDLVFGNNLDNAINLQGNLSWSSKNILNIGCVTEFVMMYRDGDNATSPATVLCPSYEIFSSENSFWCEYSLDEAFCGTRLYLMLESWSENRMLQPSTVVTVNCDKKEEHDLEANGGKDSISPLSDSNWELPLVLASLRVFTDAAKNATVKKKKTNSTKDVDLDIDLGCSWSDWGAWSGCSLTCGGRGQMTRSRSQTGSRVCGDTREEARDCHTNLCPVDCEMSRWGVWSSCSASCGTGQRSRTRTVVREAANWGNKCPANREEVEPCVEAECRVDGGWSGWSRWGYCSESCGTGTRSRSRTCSQPPPQFGGETCSGPNLETKECFLKTCPPVDGGWTTWTRWSACSTTCDWGEQRRTRTCTQPPAEFGGRECTGARFQNNKCMLRRCPSTENSETPETNVTETTLPPEVSPSPRADVINVKKCPKPPNVLGFLNPTLLGANGSLLTNISDVRPEETIIYKCSNGWVLDTFTNRRTFSISCNDDGHYDTPSSWPRCKAASHCVGPVARPAKDADIYLPVPRRDARVNTRVSYRCKQNTQIELSAGCFYDGLYRYDRAWPSCAQPSASLDLCSESGPDSANSNVIIAIPRLSETSHGWLASPGYPDTNNRSSSCSWTLKAPHGYILALGVEDVRTDSLDGAVSPVKLIEPGILRKDKMIKLSDLGRTFLTGDNIVTIKSVPGSSQAWRLSYLVIEPT